MAMSKKMFIDVKLDLKEGKNDCYLRNWVKCFLKVEAIECFPCYLKISFFNENDNARDYPFFVIRINIPGVRVEGAVSRTKTFTYGVFWKNNRKRCKLFFAFADKASCTEHMNWLKKSVDSLEDYRKKILENHRMSRSLISKPSLCKPNETTSLKEHDNLKNNMNDAQCERDLNDILGPLPAIPFSDNSSRWSIRRASNCSGIYEEIWDPSHDEGKDQNQESGESITSGIYVDMTTPVSNSTGGEIVEVPPPLPPRRRFKNHVYTDIEMDGFKNRKSAWNIKNVFGRGKGTADSPSIKQRITEQTSIKQAKIVETMAQFTKNHKSTGVTKTRSEHCQMDLLASKQNSFSSPDLTNILDLSEQPANDADEGDLNVMDIERSNSLNCSTSQFLCRPPILNISSNILWSHNLSSTLSSTCDSSAINLVGANVNAEPYLSEDISGYCKMAPILKDQKKSQTELDNFDKITKMSSKSKMKETNDISNNLIEEFSGYCKMDTISTLKFARERLTKDTDITKNITFERKYDIDEENFSLLDFSFQSKRKHSPNRGFSADENSSSGISSDEGAIYTMNSFESVSAYTNSINQSPSAIFKNAQDDTVSLTCTESPNSPTLDQINENPFLFHSTKFDDKYPSYFPNDTINSPIQETTKYTVNNKNLKILPRIGRQSTILHLSEADEHHSMRKVVVEGDKTKTSETSNSPAIRNHHINLSKNSNCKSVIKSTPIKVQKPKQRRCSIDNVYNDNPSAMNRCCTPNVKKNYKNSENCKFRQNHQHHTHINHSKMSSKQTFESKMVLSYLDPNTKLGASRQLVKNGKPQNYQNFDKNAKFMRTTSSPRRIYNKCATLAIRLKTPPTTPTDAYVDATTIGSAKMQISESLTFPVDSPSVKSAAGIQSSSDTSVSGLMRFASLTRFRKIDFSPLKLKINNILQRPNTDF